VSKYERFEMATIDRAAIKGADYNPRVISTQARARLKKGLETNGLVQPLTWNKRTGNLVSGHQRLGILDQLEGSDTYSLTVAVVDLPIEQERKINVLLNNDASMGHWDERRLLDLFNADESVDFEAFGFSANQADYFTNLMTEQNEENAAVVAAMGDALAFEEDVQAHDGRAGHAEKMERKTSFEQQVNSLLVPIKPEEWKEKSAEGHAELNAARDNYKNETFNYTYLQISFTSTETRRAFMVRLGLNPADEVIHESDLPRISVEGQGAGAVTIPAGSGLDHADFTDKPGRVVASRDGSEGGDGRGEEGGA